MDLPSRQVAFLRWQALAYVIPSFPQRYCSGEVGSGQIRLHVTQLALLFWSTTHVELPEQKTSLQVSEAKDRGTCSKKQQPAPPAGGQNNTNHNHLQAFSYLLHSKELNKVNYVTLCDSNYVYTSHNKDDTIVVRNIYVASCWCSW